MVWLCSFLPGLALFSGVASGRASAPFCVMYGHSDDAGATEHFRDVLLPAFNVIEGTSGNASFIKELRDQGKVYAAHVNNPINESAAQLLARWRAPFDNTLGGQLPGGYDAIGIDELHGTSTNGSANSDAVVSALGDLRSLYPDKQIFVATTWHYGQNSASYSEQLIALNQHVDLMMIENYLREDNYNHGFFTSYADNLKTVASGILSKSVYGLYIAQGNFAADTSTDVGFWGFLDDQMHRIQSDADASLMPGIMFWVYYQSEKDLTPAYVARLVDHYYVQGNNNHFRDGSLSQLISNPQFESGTSGWTATTGSGGSLGTFSYGLVSIENDHDNFGQTSHGASGLRMVRGSSHNEMAYRVDNLDTQMVYTVSAFVIALSTNRRATLAIAELDGTRIESETATDVGSPPDFYHRWNEWSRLDFNFVPTTSSILVVLSDEPAVLGQTVYWDFVELEASHSAPPPDVPDHQFWRGDANADRSWDIRDPLYQLYFTYVPGSRAPTCLDTADWNDDGALDAADAVYSLLYLYTGGPPPPPPLGENCDRDPTVDELGCVDYAYCGS
jgi:hypothetical protein